MSSWIEQSIEQFGRSVGIPSLAFDGDGALRLGIGSGGAIELHHQHELSPPALLLIVSEPVGFNRAARLRAALRHADFRQQAVSPLHVALDGDQLVLATRMDERAFSHSALEAVLDQLDRLHLHIAERG